MATLLNPTHISLSSALVFGVVNSNVLRRSGRYKSKADFTQWPHSVAALVANRYDMYANARAKKGTRNNLPLAHIFLVHLAHSAKPRNSNATSTVRNETLTHRSTLALDASISCR